MLFAETVLGRITREKIPGFVEQQPETRFLFCSPAGLCDKRRTVPGPE